MNAERSQERGSALIIALLVTVVLALLGISFLLMAETENRIARNERRSAQALYAAQSTVRVVKSWFDAPTTAMLVPGPGQIDRTQRSIVAAADPSPLVESIPRAWAIPGTAGQRLGPVCQQLASKSCPKWPR